MGLHRVRGWLAGAPALLRRRWSLEPTVTASLSYLQLGQ